MDLDSPLEPTSAWMSRSHRERLLWPTVIIGILAIIAFSVVVARDDSNDGPTRSQRGAYNRCMEALLPPFDEGTTTIPEGYVPPTDAQLQACKRKLTS